MISTVKMNKDIRAALEKSMDHPLPDRTWTYLTNEGKATKVASGERGLDWLEQEVWKLDGAVEGKLFDGRNRIERLTGEVVKRRRAELIGDRNEALSILHVQEARKDPDVVAWRGDLLGGKLLKPDQVEPWILEQSVRDVKGTRYLLFDVPYDGKVNFMDGTLNPALRLSKHAGGYRSSRGILYYGMPGDIEARIVQVEHRGILDRLRILGESLSDRFGWGKAEATIFLLTDFVPRFNPIRVSMSGRPSLRITITVDAVVSPREVLNAYKAARFSAQGRVRTLTRKHLTLAVFTMGREADEPVSKQMAAWNRSYPSHKYSSEGNFRRDSRAAVKRLRRRPEEGGAAVLRALSKD